MTERDYMATRREQALAESLELRRSITDQPEPHPTPTPPSTYELQVTCPHDGAPVEHITTGQASRHDTRAVIQCTQCDAVFVIAVHLLGAVNGHGGTVRSTPIEHGTERGYQQHRRRPDDPACPPCRAAHVAHNRPAKAAARAARRDTRQLTLA